MTMKKILITGANSYVGVSFEKWISQWPDKYRVDTIDMKDSAWKEKSFKGYDVIFHVAGIAHRKETKQNAHEYYEINSDLTVEAAKKAKNEGVSQFIFMSTMGVYGMLTGVITKDTVPNPKTHYGKSKLQAEEQIQKLSDGKFKVVILRPPMIYGKNCTGNYQRLRSFVLKYKIFPNITNKRSMIQIDNLSVYIQKCIDGHVEGTFFPQDPQYICTRDMCTKIAEYNATSIIVSSLFNFVRVFNTGTVKKVLGDLYYDVTDEWSTLGISFPDTVAVSEKGYIR